MKKIFFNLFPTILLITSVSTINAYAEVIVEPQARNETENVTKIENRNTDVINNIFPELTDLCWSLTRNLHKSGETTADQILPEQSITNILRNIIRDERLTFVSQVKLNDDMSLKDGDTLAAHQADLKNSTKIDQIMNTASFEYTQMDSVSTKTSHSVGVSVTTSAEMKFPFVSGSMSMTAKYDFNSTKDVVSSITKKWTVPSQSVKVPAGKLYRVKWLLDLGTATGTTDLLSVAKGIAPVRAINNTTSEIWNIGDIIDKNNRLLDSLLDPYKWQSRSSWSDKNGSEAIKKWGTSKYTAKLGTKLIMIIEDVTMAKSTPVIVESIPMDIEPIILE
ncbi:ETX/MTX2 family pore-forming toxin [Enterococcus faecalis]|uniref:ETX/MTX2 family pore-forming toxin n=1 Tax=Enterococcus faecalis TaxID=1351 RepID=UPI00242CA271|nr:ETX/MTX2 family pore-forming toxin [Enterococcus faecalis]